MFRPTASIHSARACASKQVYMPSRAAAPPRRTFGEDDKHNTRGDNTREEGLTDGISSGAPSAVSENKGRRHGICQDIGAQGAMSALALTASKMLNEDGGSLRLTAGASASLVVPMRWAKG